MTRHLLDTDDLGAEELLEVLRLARSVGTGTRSTLAGRSVALVFEKPSARTRNSSEAAVARLGGHPVYIQGAEVGIDTREPAEDVARTLACFHSVVAARVMDHRSLVRMAAALDGSGSGVPVVNLLSDVAHPCQTLADLLTVEDEFGEGWRERKVAFVGDANNVWRSLAKGCALLGMASSIASPDGYGPVEDDVAAIRALGGTLEVCTEPAEAVAGASVVVTDVWTSMGQEEEAAARLAAFAGYQVDAALLDSAAADAIVLHCLPAHRGEEIAADVVDGPRSRVWREAHHRMTAMLGLFEWLSAVDALPPAGGSFGGGAR